MLCLSYLTPLPLIPCTFVPITSFVSCTCHTPCTLDPSQPVLFPPPVPLASYHTWHPSDHATLYPALLTPCTPCALYPPTHSICTVVLSLYTPLFPAPCPLRTSNPLSYVIFTPHPLYPLHSASCTHHILDSLYLTPCTPDNLHPTPVMLCFLQLTSFAPCSPFTLHLFTDWKMIGCLSSPYFEFSIPSNHCVVNWVYLS